MSHKYLKTDVEGLVKDPVSGAVLSVDYEGLSAYKKQKAFMENNANTTKRINEVEKDLREIKEMLQLLLKSNK